MEDILLKKEAQKIILMGNDAIVRGALEAGVEFVATYPGTPASEIGNNFSRIQKAVNLHFEFSVNERLALEAAVGASYSGLKTFVAMKNFGLNICLDTLLPFVYTGTKGATVIVIADDPSCHSSAETEQNTRFIAKLAHIPVLEPSDSQECRDFVKLAYQISERFKVPVIVRTTTRVAHQKGVVKISDYIPLESKARGEFIKDFEKFVTLPPRVLEMKKELLVKMESIRKISEKSPLNKIEKDIPGAKTGIITSGVSYLYVMEALEELNLKISVLKIGIFSPLPREKIESFLKKKNKVLIVEELEPYIENKVKRVAKEANCKIKIFGKNLLPETGELRPEIVVPAVAQFAGKKYEASVLKFKYPLPKRLPQFCAGCPYWFVFGGLKKALDEKKIIFGGDIGCYMLAGFAPHNLQDYLLSMGSGVGIAHGIKKATGQKLIAFIGDSTFFHSGLPAIANAVFNKSNPLIIILKNETTGMTGHQPHPGAPLEESAQIDIEGAVRGLGVKNLKVLDPVNQKEFLETVNEFLEKPEVSVIISEHACIKARKI